MSEVHLTGSSNLYAAVQGLQAIEEPSIAHCNSRQRELGSRTAPGGLLTVGSQQRS